MAWVDPRIDDLKKRTPGVAFRADAAFAGIAATVKKLRDREKAKAAAAKSAAVALAR